MKDFIHVAVSILECLNSNTLEKNQEAIDKEVEAVNRQYQFLPIEFADGNLLIHSDSPRYGNGSLVRDFIPESNLDPEIAKKLRQLYEFTHAQKEKNVKAHTAVIELALAIISNLNHSQDQISCFFLCFPDYIWEDKKLIEQVEELISENLSDWFEVKKSCLDKNPVLYLDLLGKLDPESKNRTLVKEFTDTYYGLDFLDNF